MNYESAPEVEAVAKEVIAEHFNEIEELQRSGDLKIAYLWRPEAQSVGEGRVVAGCCVHVDDRNHALHGFDFMVIIARDLWEESVKSVSPQAHRALVHHELCHIGVRYDEEGAVKTDEESGRLATYCRRHDVEEFEDVMCVYGAWHVELRRFLAAYNKEVSE